MFSQKQKFTFRENFRESFVFRHDFFAKTKVEFRENFREKTKAKTFVPTLIYTKHAVAKMNTTVYTLPPPWRPQRSIGLDSGGNASSTVYYM
jgi:hypothetical protein